jgi:hypothetical protein
MAFGITKSTMAVHDISGLSSIYLGRNRLTSIQENLYDVEDLQVSIIGTRFGDIATGKNVRWERVSSNC